MKAPQIKPHLRIEIIEPKHVYLLAENISHALTGEFYCHLIPLLDGKHTLEDISNQLAEWGTPEQITDIVDHLQTKGYLTEAVPDLPEATAAFWSLLGVEPEIANHYLQQTKVYLTAISNLSTQPLAENLAKAGIKTQNWQGQLEELDSHSLLVVLTDDYLQPQLAQINQTALESKKPWLLVKPVGGLLWFGPVFEPGQTGCWQCLTHRLRGNREVEASVLKQKQKNLSLNEQIQKLGNITGCLPVSKACLPSTLQMALNLLTTEIAKWIVKNRLKSQNFNFSTLTGKVLTFNQLDFTTEFHYLSRRPQCPTCGTSNLVYQQGYKPLTLNNCRKHFTTDGGHRACSPEQTLKRYEHLISPITGVVSALVRSCSLDSDLLHTYHAIHTYGSASSNLNRLRRLLGHKSGGKGKSDRQAKASGFCEAIERYSSLFHGDEPRITATLAELGNKAINPQKVMQFSANQYANRERFNSEVVNHNWIPLPFDESWEIEWTPVWSLVEQTHKYLPTAFCYYNYALPKNRKFFYADSNGNAAGNTLEEAILQGFMELIERDSVAIWWYNCLQCPGVDLASFNDPYLLDVQNLYFSNGRDFWVIDIGADLGIPTFAALSARIGEERENIIAGFGTHLDPRIAILRAVTEMNQLGFFVDRTDPSKTGPWGEWLKYNLNRQTHSYLTPHPKMSLKRYEDYPKPWSDDIYDDVMTCVEIAKQAGMETLVLDQTRPDIGLNVVKVIVPGLRHFWSRFAPGRLYDVPVKMGYLSEPLTEEQLNPVPMLL
ncbi:MAG: TOMM precursor leader peptide-binding protein [Merismopedia sp. SIO2A8]|nr:TOMM precursor leader peptide-binding protein [Symploca sp. SIO2B6]NET47311.1 TOMM precursor leader peptide-binding protein [Merismopedia sp. SIO2A8]